MTITAPELTDTMYELAMQVGSQRDFERFLDRLADDYEVNKEVWENHSVPEFLIALADCSRRSAQSEQMPAGATDADRTSWQRLARLLLGASVLK